MPKYVLPKRDDTLECIPCQERVHLPANKAIVKELEVGEKYQVVLEGKVVMLEEGNFALELKSVEVYGKNEFEKLSRDDDA